MDMMCHSITHACMLPPPIIWYSMLEQKIDWLTELTTELARKLEGGPDSGGDKAGPHSK